MENQSSDRHASHHAQPCPHDARRGKRRINPTPGEPMDICRINNQWYEATPRKSINTGAMELVTMCDVGAPIDDPYGDLVSAAESYSAVSPNVSYSNPKGDHVKQLHAELTAALEALKPEPEERFTFANNNTLIYDSEQGKFMAIKEAIDILNSLVTENEGESA